MLQDSAGRSRVVVTSCPPNPQDPRVVSVHDCPHGAVAEILSIARRIRHAVPEALKSLDLTLRERHGRVYCRARAILDLLPGQTFAI